MRKYEFTGETLEWDGRTLNRIRALMDFRNVKAGDIGGWIEKEENLSHAGDCWVYGWAKISGEAKISGQAEVYGRAVIEQTKDYMTAGPIGSRNDTATVLKTTDGARVVCGCFYGSIAEFEKKVKETHGDSQHAKEYLALAELMKIRFGE